MECLVIGGTGTISEGIAFEAIRKQHNVTIINRGNNNGRVPNGAHVLYCDVNDTDTIRELLGRRQFDVVVDPLTYNIEQIQKRIAFFQDYCRLYVFISSAAAIGTGAGILDEESPKKPKWDYGRKKLQCEEYLIGHKLPVDYLIIRPSITYGDIRIPVPVACRKNPWTLIDRIQKDKPIICFKYSGEFESAHNLMHIRDFSKYAVKLFENTDSWNNDYIICSDNTYTWDCAYNALYELLGKTKHIYEVDKKVFRYMNYSLYNDILYDKGSKEVLYSNKKVKSQTGMSIQEVSLREGLRELIEYLEKNYKGRPLENEYNYMTDAILLCGIRKRDKYLNDYLNSLDKNYKKQLMHIWTSRKINTLKRDIVKTIHK